MILIHETCIVKDNKVILESVALRRRPGFTVFNWFRKSYDAYGSPL